MNFRRLSLSVLVCLCLTTISVLAQNSPGDQVSAEAVQKEILRLEEVGRQKVLKGETAWDDLMADGAYLITSDGTIILYKKEQDLSSGLTVKSFKMSEMIVRVYGETAVVTGLAEVGAVAANKWSFSFQMRFLNVWKKFPEGWKIVVTDRTTVKAPPK